jgi:hypothetical protein
MASRPRRNAARTTITRKPSTPINDDTEITDSEKEALLNLSPRTILSVEPHDSVTTATTTATAATLIEEPN